MLSYQHAYHAGNLADVHKHQIIAKILNQMIQKDKALTYIETHAGRGLYNLESPEALKTGEAIAGIMRMNTHDLDSAYADVLQKVRSEYGDMAYPGSPKIAQLILRSYDKMHLADLHPQEFKALQSHFKTDKRIQCHHQDGFDLALSVCSSSLKRGMVLIDPSYEIKSEYYEIPKRIAQIHKKWNVGVIMLWYPILPSGAHLEMVAALKAADYPKVTYDETLFNSGLANHRLIGSGLFIINTPSIGAE